MRYRRQEATPAVLSALNNDILIYSRAGDDNQEVSTGGKMTRVTSNGGGAQEERHQRR